jgi:hypothetical protein
MRKFYFSSLVMAYLISFILMCQKMGATSQTVSTDTLFYTNFVDKPGTFTSGDIYSASTSNENKETTKNTIVFGAGPNGQRINMNTTQSASKYGSSATTYVSATADDDGANTGAFSFLTTGSGSAAGGYIKLPTKQGPFDITIWACGANTSKTQSYKIYTSSDGGTSWRTIGSASFTDLKLIHKNIFTYPDDSSVIVKLVCTTGSSSSCNLYIYNLLETKRPYIKLTSAIGTDAQTISTYAAESLTDIVYTWSSIASSASIVWSGTSSSSTPPDGITVSSDATAKTLTISGTPTTVGSYTYSVTATNDTLTTSALTGKITVVDTPIPLITLTSATSTKAQKVTSGYSITDVEYTWSGSAIDAHITWSGTTSTSLTPDGIAVTKDSANKKMYITGTPTTTGSYGWSIYSNDNSSSSSSLTGTLTVVPPPTISLTSAAFTTSQTLAFCKAITSIVYTYGGSATSATITWSGTTSSSTPPPGITVTTSTSAQTVTISGMSYTTGTYSYSITSTDGTLTTSALSGTLTINTTASALSSFPGAVGYGAHATGGRTGTVYHVTNLDDSGTGSFRDAVSASNRIIVFDVSGYITLASAVSCKSNLTIAGQTAPGEGIGFMGGEISFASQQNVICRHIRIIPGSLTASTGDDALSLYNARNIIMDHCTFEFAPWNNIDGVSDSYNVTPVTAITLQNCIDANPTYQQFGAHCESVIAQWTFYRNLFANSHNRNPLAKINDQFINNVHYNNEAGYTTHTSSTFKHDIVNNYFIWGPASGSNVPWFQIDANQSIYYPGNLCDNNLDGTLNGSTTTPYWYSGTGTILTSPWSPLTSIIPTVDATSAYRTVVSTAGTLPLSQLDSLIVNQVKTLGSGSSGYTSGTTGPASGLYTDQTQTGLSNSGYGIIRSGSKETDTDNDGMPDYWEEATGSNVSSDDAMTIGSDGYALIENYINWLAGLHKRTYQNTAVDIELSSYTGGFSSVSPTYCISGVSNGSAVLNSNGSTVTFTPASGFIGISSFIFTVTGSDNTTYTDTVKICVNSVSTDVKSVKSTIPSISIYPNPAVDKLIVTETATFNYKIYDVSGRIVAEGLSSGSGSYQKVDVSKLQSGIFFIKINDAVYKFAKK